MEDSGSPVKIPLPWAASAGGSYIRSIPTASQIGIQNGAASYTDGYPPLCFVPVATGGAGPFGQDMNGVLNQITAGLQWLQAGAPLYYDSGFSTAIGGYAKGATLSNASTPGLFWVSTADNNTSDPDTGGANWIAFPANVLTGDLDLYVASGGSDSNNGLSALTPFATIQKAFTTIQNYSLNGFTVNINIEAGFYNAGGTLANAPNGQVQLVVNGAGSVTISVTLANCLNINSGASLTISGNFVFSATGTPGSISSGCAIQISNGAFCQWTGVTFGLCTNFHTVISGQAVIGGSYAINGGAVAHHFINDPSGLLTAFVGVTVTVSATPTFSSEFISASFGAVAQMSGITYSGSATGPRYNVDYNAMIITGGAGANYFPGSTSGTIGTHGAPIYQ